MLPELPAVLCCFTDYFALNSFALSMVYAMTAQQSDSTVADAQASAVVSAQFAGVMFGHLIWGFVADRYSPRHALLLVMMGDTATFMLSGLMVDPLMLAITRFCAGMFTPMTASFAFVFDQYPPDKVLPAFAHITLAGTSGTTLGTSAVGLLYAPFANTTLFEIGGNGSVSLGWLLVNSFTALLAAMSFVMVFLSPKAPDNISVSGKKEPKQISGIWKALKSPLLISMFFSSFLGGWLIASMAVIPGLIYKSVFGLSATEATIIFLSITFPQLFVAKYVLPKIANKLGKTRTSSMGGLASAVMCCLIGVTPLIETRTLALSFMVLSHCLQKICTIIFFIPNQAKVQVIAGVYTVNGRGIITAFSRVIFAFGQAMGPAISISMTSAFPNFGFAGPWVLLSALLLAQYAIYLMLGVPIFREHQVAVKFEAGMALEAAKKLESAKQVTS